MNSMNKRIRELEEQLAASQAREQQLLEVIRHCKDYAEKPEFIYQVTKTALALPQDTSALDQIKASYEAQIKVLREALLKAEQALKEENRYVRAADMNRALALPQDDTALRSIVAKAGEVMRERAIRSVDLTPYKLVADERIRALTGVTMEDLQK